MIDRYRDGVVPEAEPLAGAGERLRRAWPTRSSELLDRVEPSLALDEIWQRVKRLNRFVQDEEPWKLSKDEAAGGAPRRGALLAGRGAPRGVGAAARVHAGRRRAAARGARARGRLARQRRASARCRAAAHDRRARPSSSRAWSPPRPRPPSGRRGPPGGRHPLPPRLLRAPGRRARRAGPRGRRQARSPRSGTDGPSIERALAAAHEHPEVTAIVGRHPHETAGFGAGRPRGDRAGGRRSRRARHRRDRARLLPRPRSARGPAPRLRGAARAGGAARAAGGHPHPCRRGPHVRAAARARRRRSRR